MSRSVVKYVMKHNRKGISHDFKSDASIVAIGVAATLATKSYEERLTEYTEHEQKLIRCLVYREAHHGECDGCPRYTKGDSTDEQDTSGSTEPSTQ